MRIRSKMGYALTMSRPKVSHVLQQEIYIQNFVNTHFRYLKKFKLTLKAINSKCSQTNHSYFPLFHNINEFVSDISVKACKCTRQLTGHEGTGNRGSEIISSFIRVLSHPNRICFTFEIGISIFGSDILLCWQYCRREVGCSICILAVEFRDCDSLAEI